MKVAIIGAGPAGLSCALELEKHGIVPDIFEQRHRPGDLFDHCAAVLQLFTRPNDPLQNLKDKFSLELQPLAMVKSIRMKSPHKEAVTKGNLGYFFLRGGDPNSLESQLYRKLKNPIITNTKVKYSDIYQDYDYVVDASGGREGARSEGIWSTVYDTYLIGGSIIGEFNQSELLMWIDTRYSRTAYAYLAPIEPRRAFLGLVVPNSSVDEARLKWKDFWELERHPYEQVNEIIVEHKAGFVYPHQVGNIIFAGIAGGFQEPFLGFGMISSLKSGVLAGRSIAEGNRYEDLLIQLKEDMKHSLVLREMFNSVDNTTLDRVVALLGTSGIKQFLYNTNIDVARIGSAAVSHFKKALSKIRQG